MSIKRRIIRADWVLPVSSPPLKDYAVLVESDRIAGLIPVSELTRYPASEVHYVQNSILLPAWVNAHTHLELSVVPQTFAAAGKYTGWISEVTALRQSLPIEQIGSAAERSARACRNSGTALLADISNLPLTDLVMPTGLERIVYYELINFLPNQAGFVFEQAQRLKDRHDLHLTPHALHSVSAELLRKIRNSEHRITLHFAESPEEAEFLLTASGPFRDFLNRIGRMNPHFTGIKNSLAGYAAELGLFDDPVILVHGVQVTPADLEILGHHRTVSICLCPGSNLTLNVGLPPVEKYLNKDVNLIIGTDSMASNEDLDMNREINLLGQLFPELAADKIIEMATINGAKALGRCADYGTIEPGKLARLNLFSFDYKPGDDPCAEVVARNWSKLECI